MHVCLTPQPLNSQRTKRQVYVEEKESWISDWRSDEMSAKEAKMYKEKSVEFKIKKGIARVKQEENRLVDTHQSN
eukprot:2709138-Rhodomonas_salina.1